MFSSSSFTVSGLRYILYWLLYMVKRKILVSSSCVAMFSFPAFQEAFLMYILGGLCQKTEEHGLILDYLFCSGIFLIQMWSGFTHVSLPSGQLLVT